MSNIRTAYMFTDGACSGNPGPGGYGVIIMIPGYKARELHGYSINTTNNRMELQAVIDAIAEAGHMIKSDKCDFVCINLDSSYVYNAITQCWVNQWSMNGWKNKSNAEVKNSDLWKLYLNYASADWFKNISFRKVKGHANVVGNEAADKIAVTMRDVAVSERMKVDKDYTPPKSYKRGLGYKDSWIYSRRNS